LNGETMLPQKPASPPYIIDPAPSRAADTVVSTSARRLPRRGDMIEVRVDAFDARGFGIGRTDDLRVRVKRAVPGDLVRARVLRRRGANVDAIVVEVMAPSARRAEPVCAHFGSCGGCSFQHLEYAAQLEGLHALVEQSFREHGLLRGVSVDAVVPADDPWRYRNKMEFTFGARRWIDPREPPNARADFALGLHAAEMHSKVIDVQSCAIQLPIADRILATARRLACERSLAPWDIRSHTGLLRHLVLRSARSTGELMVNLVTSSAAPELIDEFAAAIVSAHPEITTFVQNVTARKAAVAVGESERVLHGDGLIRERILGVTFAISANAFFQTNTAQAEKLFAIVREEARLAGGERVFDLYCGGGSIALVLASGALEVVGFEQSSAAVADARRNARANAIVNTRFVEGDVLAAIGAGAAGLPRPDVCTIDPPRAGLHPRVLPLVVALAPQRIVYVSCNPAAAARDVEHFTRHGYEIASLRPIDLFPHTPHVECVIRLERVEQRPSVAQRAAKSAHESHRGPASDSERTPDREPASDGEPASDCEQASDRDRSSRSERSSDGARASDTDRSSDGERESDTEPEASTSTSTERSSATSGAPDPVRSFGAPTLCASCCHVKIVRSERGSTFYLCQLAARDDRFRKYPPQPVLECAGFER
jgi:23S rRNA (uracil1939-C5)-methyltransferase